MDAKDFKTTGPIVDFDNTVYVKRKEDKEVLDYILRKEHVAILGARQTGKTSLLYNIKGQLGEGYIPIYIDLSAGDSMMDETKWYRQFICERILDQVIDKFTSDIAKQKVVSAENKIGFLNFLNQVALGVKPDDIIVMMMDEFGTVPEGLCDNFFGAIRTVHNERTIREGFKKWIFVLAGATDPRELISLKSRNSPFNITKRIYMSDFDKKEDTSQVVENLRAHGIQLEKEEEIINRIHEQTGGHPNLVQKICVNLMESGEKTVSPASVDKAVEKLSTEGDDNIRRIYEELNKDESVRRQAKQILEGKKLKFDRDNPTIFKLELIGLIKSGNDGNCIIRNPIYKQALDEYSPSEPITTVNESEKNLIVEKIRENHLITLPQLEIQLRMESQRLQKLVKELVNDKQIRKVSSKGNEVTYYAATQAPHAMESTIWKYFKNIPKTILKLFS